MADVHHGAAALRPCTRAQRWLWTLDSLLADRSEYNVYQAIRVRGALDVERLRRAATALSAGHELLRTRYRMTDDGLVGEVRRADDDVLGRVAADSFTDALDRALRLVREPFDLGTDRPLRAWVLDWAPQDRLLVLCSHHIAVDAWSMDLLWRQWGEAYDGAPPSSTGPSWAELVRREEDLRGDEFYLEDLEYWRAELAGWTALDIPADRPRPPRRSGRGAEITIDLDPELAAVRAGGRGTTPLMVATAAVLLTLARWTGRADVALGAVVSLRDDPDLAETLGYFVNTVVLREQVAEGDTVAGFLARVRGRTLEAYSRAQVPFAELATEVAAHDASRNPLIDVLLAWIDETPHRFRPAGLDTEAVDLAAQTAKYDLGLTFTRRPGGLRLAVSYATEMFDADTARRFARHVGAVLRAFAEDPDRPLAAVRLLDDDERARLVAESAPPPEPIDPRRLPEILAGRVRAGPDAPAIHWGTVRWSYRDLDRAVRVVARRLRALGVGRGDRVALRPDRTPWLVAALFGVLAVGAAYVPIDPEQPPERVRLLLTRAAPALELDPQRLAAWSADDPDPDPDPDSDPDPEPPSGDAADPAYVIHTSGSAGRPHGVVVAHRAVVNLSADLARRFGWGPGETVAAVAPYSFDMSVPELLSPLLAGAAVRLVPREAALDPARLAAELAGVTFAQLTPVHWQALLDHGWSDGRLRAASGAEALPAALAARLRDAVGELWNLYGPTEATVWSTAHRVEAVTPGAPVPVGRPLANTTAIVLDALREPVPVGVVGELHLGGAGLALGYDGEPELTAERFVPDPFRPGERLYRTGDLARRRADGALEFVARADAQVKVRGFRIEPGEVEAALERHPDVVRSAVAPAGEGAERRLVGFVVLRPGGEVEAARKFVTALLPAYAVPAALVAVERLPVTARGKLDRGALPAVDDVPRPAPTAPRTAAERAVAAAFGRVLGGGAVGAEDDFFALGGHSLSVSELVAALRADFGDRAHPRLVFAHPRVDALAAALNDAPDTDQPPPAEHASPAADAVVTVPQRAMWLRERAHPGRPEFTVPRAVRLTGPLDAAALERALHALAARHDLLRSSFPEAADVPGEPVRRVDVPPPPLLRTGAADLAAARDVVDADAARAFDVTRGPLWHARLVRVGDGGDGGDDHVLVLTFHHLVVDGPSFPVLWRELAAAYDGVPLAPPSLRFADFALAQAAATVPDAAPGRHAADGPATELPRRVPRSAGPVTRGAELPFTLAPDLAERARDLARAEGTTVFTVFLAVLAALVGGVCRQERPVLGSPLTGRDRPELDELIGPFAHTVALRVDCTGDPDLRELIARAHRSLAAARVEQRVPGRVAAAPGAPDRPGPAQITLLVADAETLALPGIRAEMLPVAVPVVPYGHEMIVELHGDGDGYRGLVVWDPADYDRDAMAALADGYAEALATFLRRPRTRCGEPAAPERVRRAFLGTGSAGDSAESAGDSAESAGDSPESAGDSTDEAATA